jgi:hypothetical protein
VGDSTWLKYIIGITCLAYTLIHNETLVVVLGWYII